jgi:hypothetical protein
VDEEPTWESLRGYFTPPARYEGDFGNHPSLLTFDDGRPVRSAADWPARRAEILARWHGLMGLWPPLLEEPRLLLRDGFHVGDVTIRPLTTQVAGDLLTDGYLCLPENLSAPAPAVLTLYYEPESGIGRNPEVSGRQFALELARRGFVALSMGWRPSPRGDGWQPLSYLAYCAANCRRLLGEMEEVDAGRVGVFGHSYGGKWALFAACLDEGFAAGAWSDPGIVFDETREDVNYWDRWYLGDTPGEPRPAGPPSTDNPRRGAYAEMVRRGMDLPELLALMAPRPMFVSGGSEDPPGRWRALNRVREVYDLLDAPGRVGMANRRTHAPGPSDTDLICRVLGWFLGACGKPC